MTILQGSLWKAPTLGMLILATACGGGDGAANSTAEQEGAASAAPATQVVPAQPPQNEAVAPEPGGQVIEVQMKMEGATKAVFEPAKITARQGDVVRFVNVDNVHNVSFPKGNNPSGVTLPPTSPYLTQPGQVYELKVDLPAGTYDFQCDPHAAMGMVGQLTVAQ